MLHLTEVLLLSLVGSILTLLLKFSFLRQRPTLNFSIPFFKFNTANHDRTKTNTQKIQEINTLADCHETAARLSDLVRKDGAGSWPPRCNHVHSTWPAALRPYREIYNEMAPLLPAAHASTDDSVNLEIITTFRARFRKLLDDKVDLDQVNSLLAAADAGRWDVFPRDTYNAFYACVAWCRHAYRWASIPVVRLAQREESLPLPRQLVLPWNKMQTHFSMASDSGNNMSNLVLNFTPAGEYMYRINTGLSSEITSSEEEFSKIFFEVESLAMPIYHAMVQSIIAFARDDKVACLGYVREITNCLRPLLGAYYDRVHDSKIKRSVWLSRVQGFYAWGMTGEERDVESQQKIRFDGLSGNQVLLFQALDAFLGLDPYLTREVLDRNVPGLQRGFCDSLLRHCFRGQLKNSAEKGGIDAEIQREIGEIIKRLRVFRSAHRTRAKAYLSQPAPERMPMTAGKSLLQALDSGEGGMTALDEFMMKRLRQTV
ncbi:hypothetical protein QBC43DRAFT_376906 [Cladorrhinum sp. PSN259]|nr:hypothetical protein QBC43DRAFT_376906 [Cladorrhinum sp. PSN259]